MAAAQAMWASGQGQVRGEGTRQGVVAGAWWRVADVGAGHQGSDAPQRLLVDEQFLEEFPECVGGGVVAAPQGHLGPGVEQRAFAGLASVAQQLQDLPAETAGLRDVSDLRLPFQYRGSHSGQAQFTGEHQAGGAGAHDDDAGVRHWPLPPRHPMPSPPADRSSTTTHPCRFSRSVGPGFGSQFCGRTRVLRQAPLSAID